MTAQTTLTLGDFEFSDLEIPEHIAFGGDQSLTVHKMVGGARTVDSMGVDDMPLEWSGWFTGESALDRALYLDTQRKLGQAMVLTWSELRYSVVIQHFEASYEAINRIPYRITCVIAEDQTSPVTTIVAADIDDQMSDDMDSATSLAGDIGDSSLTTLVSAVSTAISSVSSFSNASPSTLSGVSQPITSAQTKVSSLLASAVSTADSVTTVGGVSSSSAASSSAASLAAQSTAFTQQSSLLSLQSTLGRMSTNLGNVTQSSKSITTAGGDLYAIASQQYGDATSWTGIANANGLTDPSLTGTNTLVIPAIADSTSGGILGL